ncbi:MAG: hypothetical protein Q9195_005176 [Heterodermia aff. obscurata]
MTYPPPPTHPPLDLESVRRLSRERASTLPSIPTLITLAHSRSDTPLIPTTIADIAILALRTGSISSPKKGVFTAPLGRTRRAISARSLGRRPHTPSPTTTTPSYIETPSADMLAFGILPVSNLMRGFDYMIGTIDEVYSTLDGLDPSGAASKAVRDARAIDPSATTFGVEDLIPLATKMLRQRGSTVTRVPIPSGYCLGLMCHTEGFVGFYHRIGEDIAARGGCEPDGRVWVLETYGALREGFREWEDEEAANRDGGPGVFGEGA